MWTLDEILLTATLTGRFLAVGLLLAVVFGAIWRQRRVQRRQAVEVVSRGELHAFHGGVGGGGEVPPPGAGRRSPDPGLDQGLRKKRAEAYREGILTFIGLAVLTAIEFAASVWLGSLVLLFITALLKAALIIQYFMNVSRVWKQEGEEHA